MGAVDSVGVRELRQDLSVYLRRIEQGEMRDEELVTYDRRTVEAGRVAGLTVASPGDPAA